MHLFYIKILSSRKPLTTEFELVQRRLKNTIDLYYREVPDRLDQGRGLIYVNYFTTPMQSQIEIITTFYLNHSNSSLFKSDKIVRAFCFWLDYDSSQGNFEFSSQQLKLFAQTDLNVAFTNVRSGLVPFSELEPLIKWEMSL